MGISKGGKLELIHFINSKHNLSILPIFGLKADTFENITIPFLFLISTAIEEEYPPVPPLCQ